MIDYEDICRKTIAVAVEAGQLIRKERKTFSLEKVETKGLHDFVSYVDKSSEQLIVKGLSSILPEAGFITEEKTVKQEMKHYRWVVDPLDGTTNFIHGISPFAVSIGLLEGDEIVVGVVQEVNLDECFYSWKGAQSFLNGNPIHVSDSKNIEGSLVATGFPYYDFARLPQYIKMLEHMMRNSQGVRRLGSAATDLCYVAAGRFDTFFEYSLQPHDVAAGSLIVKNAGGSVFDFKGEKNYIFGKEIVACNRNLSEEMQQLLNTYLNKQ